MTWFDVVLSLLLAATTAFGVKRRMIGFVVGLGALILFKLPLLAIFNNNVFVGILLAIGAGLLLGFVGRSFIQRRRGSMLPFTILGGVGGFVLGNLLVLSIIVSLPLSFNANNQIVYPDQQSLPPSLRGAVTGSYFVSVGRDILLYPLLDQEGRIAQGQRGFYSGLHNFFIGNKKPWEGGPQALR